MANYDGDLTPLSPWAYFGLSILYSIPFIGFIILLVNAIGAENVNKRTYARSYFCWLAIVGIIVGAMIICGGWASFLQRIRSLLN